LTAPITFFFLVLPYGISSGFVSITLPFFLVRAGFSVALAASIVAVSVSANLWRFLWGPVADLTLTARRWYFIGFSRWCAWRYRSSRLFWCARVRGCRPRGSSSDKCCSRAKLTARYSRFFLD
jgi:hypothetical protein